MAVIKIEKMYEEFRKMALSTKPKDIGIRTLPEKEITVFGMIMETGYDDGVVTTVAYSTGDASMYYSWGGSFINGASHPEIKNAAKEFVTFSQDFVKLAAPEEASLFAIALPSENVINFCFLTNKGNFFAKERAEKFGAEGSQWSPLFKSGNKLIDAINKYSEVKIKHKYFSGTK